MFNNVIRFAEISNDPELIKKLNLNEKCLYHPICRTTYQNNSEAIVAKNKPHGNWHLLRETHKQAFKAICEFIDNEIVQNKKVYYLSNVFQRYKNLLFENCNAEECKQDFKSYTPQNLQEKILKHFVDAIIISASESVHKKKIVYSREIGIEELLSSCIEDEDMEFENVAYDLRNIIKSLNPNTLPEKLSVEDIIKGECGILDELFNFVCCLVQGPDIRRKNSPDDFIRSLFAKI